MTLWVCRAGRNGEYENYFIEKKIIAITWSGLHDDITQCDTYDKLRTKLTEIYPDEKKGAISNFVGQLFPFVNTMKIGEKVLLPSKINPGTFYVATITGECIYDNTNAPYSHTRTVVWSEKTINRSELDADIRNSLGAFRTIFSINDEMEKRIFRNGNKPNIQIQHTENNDDGDIDEIEPTNLENDALEQISAKIIQKFKGYDMQRVIASIFKAKGYETFVSSGADKGIDVLASDGPLGFGGTKICIQVKTESEPIPRNIIDQLNGTMIHIGAEYGLLVSWSGFKSSIDAEKRDRFFSMRFWDHSDIVREFLENYDNLDDWIKAKVPLKKIWVIDDQTEPE